MPTYYLETSALFKRYRSEPGSEVVRELFEHKQLREVFITSHLSLLEVHTVAARMLKGRELRRRQYDRLIMAFLKDLIDYQVRGLPVEDALVDEAIALMPHYPLRTADSLHVATAVRVSREVGDGNFYLVSGDKDITDVCRQYPLRFLDPEDPAALGYLRGLR